MGLITKSFEEEKDLTVFSVVREVNAEQLLAEILGFLTGEPTQLVLWDITAGSLVRITARDLRMIAQKATKHADRRKGGRTAIACSTEVDFGMSRMFQAFAELLQAPVEFNVSKDIRDAKQWLALG
jgi:hypothetical protein